MCVWVFLVFFHSKKLESAMCVYIIYKLCTEGGRGVHIAQRTWPCFCFIAFGSFRFRLGVAGFYSPPPPHTHTHSPFLLLHSFLLLLYSSFAGVYSRGFVGVSPVAGEEICFICRHIRPSVSFRLPKAVVMAKRRQSTRRHERKGGN